MHTDDPIRDKYIHATAWDYSTGDPMLEERRRRLAMEYDRGRPAGLPLPSDPESMRRLMRRLTLNMLHVLADRRLITDPDMYQTALYPFPDRPCGTDMLMLQAFIRTFTPDPRDS